MRIGIDARMYRSSVAGIGRYSQNLIKNLAEIDRDDEFVLFMTADDYREFKKSKIQNPNVKIVTTNIAHYSLAEQTKLPKIIEAENLDLMHFLNFNYPVQYRGKFIVTIHDLTLIKFPDTAKKTNLLKKSAFNYVMAKACQNSAKIIAVSENTKKDIINQFKVKSEKVKVIYEAVDDKIFQDISKNDIAEIKKKYRINKPIILSVGQFRPHKNLVGLVEAFALLRKEIPSQLVILGQPDAKHTRLTEAVSKNPYQDDIIMPGFVAEKELVTFYKLAVCFVFPSLYEGFGLPGLEAMQALTPVVSSNQSALPEIYHEAAIYFDPFKTQDISAKIKAVLQDKKLRAELINNGYKIARSYSWKKCAQETLKVYKEVSGDRF